jgi:hypothetical protein
MKSGEAVFSSPVTSIILSILKGFVNAFLYLNGFECCIELALLFFYVSILNNME